MEARTVHSPGWCCDNRSAPPQEDGIWVSSRLPSLPGGLNPYWFSPLDAMQAPLLLWFGDSWVGLRPSLLGKGSILAKIPLSHCTWVWVPALSAFPPFLPVSLCLLQPLGYNISVPLAFSWLCRLIALWFSYKYSLVPDTGRYSFHLLCSLLEIPLHVFPPYAFSNSVSDWMQLGFML